MPPVGASATPAPVAASTAASAARSGSAAASMARAAKYPNRCPAAVLSSQARLGWVAGTSMTRSVGHTAGSATSVITTGRLRWAAKMSTSLTRSGSWVGGAPAAHTSTSDSADRSMCFLSSTASADTVR